VNKKLAPCISILGTGSDVGKSIITSGICRVLVNRGIRVAPFKAQNMSNNSGVTPEGLEMGRAQIVQAEAARIPPHVDMNPILLKPTSDVGSQVVLMGKAVANRTAKEYHRQKKELLATATASLDRLRHDYDLVVMEGAGSCAEVNLMAHDLVNFRMAEYADAPVILVADIHRGGVFAQIVGTLACISQDLQDRVAGFMINRFRGDIDLIRDGVEWIEERTGKPGLGVVPWYNHFHIEEEDSVVIEQPKTVSVSRTDRPAIAVIRIPHISNFTDFDPLMALEDIDLAFIEKPQDLSMFQAVILPGSKNTCFDLEWLNSSGWKLKLDEFAKLRGNILGICGGYQMMGKVVHDPHGLEGKPGSSQGLGLLPVETILEAPKTTTCTRFSWQGATGSGYEIHMGQTQRFGGTPLFDILERNSQSLSDHDGCQGGESGIMGTYVHGMFDSPDVTRLWLERIGLAHVNVSAIHGPESRDRDYDLLAEHLMQYADVDGILKLVGIA
jgi:adenosylcobyric acid synthase